MIPLACFEQILDLRIVPLDVVEHRRWKLFELLCLIDQHLGFVLQAFDLILDLLQGAGGGQQVLAVVRRIEDKHLGAHGLDDGHREDDREEWGDHGDMIFAETSQGLWNHAGEKIGGPGDAFGRQPGRREVLAAGGGESDGNGGLVGF